MFSGSVGQACSPSRKMHKLKPGGVGSSGGMQMVWDSAPGVQPFPSHARANVFQCSESTFAGMVGPGAHPFSVIVSGSIFTEYAFPAGTWVVPSQSPSQGAGAFQ
jgi:hypothetical protein